MKARWLSSAACDDVDDNSIRCHDVLRPGRHVASTLRRRSRLRITRPMVPVDDGLLKCAVDGSGVPSAKRPVDDGYAARDEHPLDEKIQGVACSSVVVGGQGS
jgi:hypothetical protein